MSNKPVDVDDLCDHIMELAAGLYEDWESVQERVRQLVAERDDAIEECKIQTANAITNAKRALTAEGEHEEASDAYYDEQAKRSREKDDVK